jgi:anti-sigma B factor antagonist
VSPLTREALIARRPFGGQGDVVNVSVAADDSTGATVMQVTGEVDVVAAAVLRRQLALHMGSSRPSPVVDLSAVTFLDSTGLGVLLRAARQLRDRGGRTEIVVDEGRVVGLLRLAAVAQFLHVHRTVTDALAALGDEE